MVSMPPAGAQRRRPAASAQLLLGSRPSATRRVLPRQRSGPAAATAVLWLCHQAVGKCGKTGILVSAGGVSVSSRN